MSGAPQSSNLGFSAADAEGDHSLLLENTGPEAVVQPRTRKPYVTHQGGRIVGSVKILCRTRRKLGPCGDGIVEGRGKLVVKLFLCARVSSKGISRYRQVSKTSDLVVTTIVRSEFPVARIFEEYGAR